MVSYIHFIIFLFFKESFFKIVGLLYIYSALATLTKNVDGGVLTNVW